MIMPVLDRELAGDQGRARSMTLFDDFEGVSAFGVGERSQPQVVDHNQMGFGEAFQQGAIAAIGRNQMRITRSIEDPEVVKKILKHLGLWPGKRRPQLRAYGPPLADIHLDCSDFQIPPSEDDLYRQPEYPMDAYTSRATSLLATV
jgi:hypothetical protein